MKKIFIILLLFFSIENVSLYSNSWFQKSDSAWNSSLRLKKKGNIKKAIKEIKKSLLFEKKSHNPRISEALKKLNKLANLYFLDKNYANSSQTFKTLIKTAKKYQKNLYVTKGFLGLGKCNLKKNKNSLALSEFKKALKNFPSDSYDILLKAKILIYIADSYSNLKNFTESLAFYLKALTIAEKANIPSNISAIKNNIGNLYLKMKNYFFAIKFYEGALRLDKNLASKKNISTGLSNLANLYSKIEKFGEAINYYKEAINLDLQLNNISHLAIIYNNLGEVYSILGDTDNAIKYFKLSLKLNKKLNQPHSLSFVYKNLGNLYRQKGDLNSALTFFMKAVNIDKSLMADKSVAAMKTSLAYAYLRRGRFSSSIAILENNLDYKNQGAKELALSFFNIGKILILQKKEKRAIKFFKKALKYDKSLGDNFSIALDFYYIGIAYKNLYNEELAEKFFSLSIKQNVLNKKNLLALNLYRNTSNFLTEIFLKKENIKKALMTNELLRLNIFSIYANKKLTSLDKIKNFFRTNSSKFKNKSYLIFTDFNMGKPAVILLSQNKFYFSFLKKEKFLKGIFKKYARKIISYKKQSFLSSKLTNNNKKYLSYNFYDVVLYYNSLLKKRYINFQDIKEIKELGHYLFKFLFPLDIFSKLKLKSLVIVMNSSLSTLPFEILSTGDGEILLEKFNLSYSISPFLNFSKVNSKSIRYYIAEDISSHKIFNKEKFTDKFDLYAKQYFHVNQDFKNFKKEYLDFSAKKFHSFLKFNFLANKKLKTTNISKSSFFVLDSPVILFSKFPNFSLFTNFSKGSNPKFINSINYLKNFNLKGKIVILPKIIFLNMGAGFINSSLKQLIYQLYKQGASGVILRLWKNDSKYNSIFYKNIISKLNKKNNVKLLINNFKRNSESQTTEIFKNIKDDFKNSIKNPYNWGPYIYYGN